jgi:hypothetical protein
MRWEYYEVGDSSEARSREATLEAIGRWWEAFAARERDLRAAFKEGSAWDLSGWTIEQLGAVSPKLMWEYGPALQCDGHRLVITPEYDTHLRPLVRALLKRRPRIDGWEFYEYRLAESLPHTLDTVRARSKCEFAGAQVIVRIGKHQRLDLTYIAPPGFQQDEKVIHNAAFVATETLLGEEVLDQWIGGIEAKTPPGLLGKLFGGQKEPKPVPLERLEATVRALIGSMSEQLRARTWAQEDMEKMQYSGLRGKPEEKEDYPFSNDMFTASTAYPEMWMAARAPGFYSRRFSRHGELFGHIKVDREGPLGKGTINWRAAIEEGVEKELKKRGCGRVIGGASGLKYDYVEVALTDVGRTIPPLRGLAEVLGLSKRSWLMFYDADLAAEWVGLWPDSPAPVLGIADAEPD